MISHRLLLSAALLSAAQAPAAELLAPTGPYAVGRAEFHWIDGKRPELDTRMPDDRRELLVYVFHPARAGTGRPAAYMPGAEEMREVWKDEITSRVKALRARSREGAGLPEGNDRFPVVLFGPGGGQKALAYTSLLEDLASHGYVVAAIERPFNAPATRLPDGRVLRMLPAAEQGWEDAKTWEESGRLFEQKVAHWARDMSFVLDRLADLDAGSGPFAGRLALDRAGAFGHSNGGQAAATARLLDSRIRGAINIDGNNRGRMFQPLRGAAGGTQPLLWILAATAPLTDEDLARRGVPRARYDEFPVESDRLMGSVRGGAATVAITRPAINHMDFSDRRFWEELAPDVLAGKKRTMEETRRYVRAFFDGVLRGRWEALRTLLSQPHRTSADVTVRQYGSIIPAESR